MKELLDLSQLLGLPENASSHGAEIDYMISLVHWLMLILFIGWGSFFLYTLFRFRQSKNPKASYTGVQSHFSTYTEGGIVVAESVLLLAFAFPVWGMLKTDFPAAETAIEVRVVGEQFAWNFHLAGPDGVFGRTAIDLIDTQFNPLGLDLDDPNGQDDLITINELHLPVNTPVTAHISSKDVIHSFSLPTMRVKQDAIPGLEIPIWFVPTKTGRSDIGCAQLCGLGHARMHGWLTIHSQEDYNTWQQSYLDDLEEFGR